MSGVLLALACILCIFTDFIFGEIIEILNREHWDDLIVRTDGSDTIWKDSVILFYGEGNKCTLGQAKSKTGFTDAIFPSKEHLLFGQHDHVGQSESAWYQWSDDYNLKKHCGVTECPTVVMKRKLENTNDGCEKWDGEGKLRDWINERIQVQVTFKNTFDGPVDIEMRCPIPAQYSISETFNESDQESDKGVVKITSLPECIAVITAKVEEGGGEVADAVNPETGPDADSVLKKEKHSTETTIFLGAWDITEDMSITIPDKASETNEERVLVKIGKRRGQLASWLKDFIWNHTRRHLKVLKQAILVPLFTYDGYEKRKMPPKLYELLSSFYESNKHRRVAESWPDQNFQINQHEIALSMVTISPYVINRTDAILRPIIREWIGGEWVNFRTLYGLREYYQGSVLKTHLDRVGTHSLGVILNVAQDMNGDGCEGECEPWELEMTDREGAKHHLSMEAGDMVLYEPGSVPHGRPKPLQGNIYVNAFCHWIVDDWDFKLTRNTIIDNVKNRVIKMQPSSELVDVLKAEFEERKAQIKDGSPRIIPKMPAKAEEKTMENIASDASKWKVGGPTTLIVSGRKGFNRELNGIYDKLGEMKGRNFYKRRVKSEYGISEKPVYLYHFQNKWRFRGSPQINDSSMSYVASNSQSPIDAGRFENWRVWDGDKWTIEPNIRILAEEIKPKPDEVNTQSDKGDTKSVSGEVKPKTIPRLHTEL